MSPEFLVAEVLLLGNWLIRSVRLIQVGFWLVLLSFLLTIVFVVYRRIAVPTYLLLLVTLRKGRISCMAVVIAEVVLLLGHMLWLLLLRVVLEKWSATSVRG